MQIPTFFIKAFLPSIFLVMLITPSSLHAQQVAQSAEEVHPVLNNSIIPDVSVKNMDGETVQLRKLVSQKPSVIIFYRGGWCPYCSRHLAGLQEIKDDLNEIGYQILAISPDRPEKLREATNKNALGYTLLSDSPMDATKAFGLAFKVDESTVSRYKEAGIDLEADSGHDHHLLPAPAVFIVNTEGRIKFSYVNPDYRIRINERVLLTAAEEYLD